MKTLPRTRFFKQYSPLKLHPGVPEISGDVSPLLRLQVEKFARRIRFAFSVIPETAFQSAVRELFPDASPVSEEAFLLTVTKEQVAIASPGHAGIFYGFQAFLTETEENGFHELELYEAPLLPERGLKLYLPPPTQAQTASGRIPVISLNCSRASIPTHIWKSRTISGNGCGPSTEPMQ